jgi:putative nucleotidyltransferase with HDIG domain
MVHPVHAGVTKIDILAPFRKIRVKASLFVILLLVSSALAFSLVTLRTINRRILGEVMKRAETLSRAAASTAGYALISQDLLGLDNIVYRIKSSSPDIVFLAVVSEEGEILAHSDTKKTGESYRPAAGKALEKAADGTTVSEIPASTLGMIEARTPIVFLEKPLGSVVLAVNKAAVVEAQKEAERKILAVFGILLLAGVTGSLALTTFLTRPVRELSAGVAELTEGRRTRPLRVFSRDELGRLTESFNEMTALITMQKDSLSRSARDLEEACVATVRVLAAAIDARDTSTLGHSTRVAQLSLELGRELGFDAARLEELEIACLFHDVGKIRIPDSILLKKDRLDPAEEREMMRHPEYGAEILSKAGSLEKYIPAVRHHHEWYDGTGYPGGLKGEGIPLYAAIISLADVYDALTSDRPYRRGLSAEEAQTEIAGRAQKQFDPELTGRFVALLKKKEAASQSGGGPGG